MSNDVVESFWIVVNDEEQYSIWSTGQDIPEGWTSVGEPGPKEQCLAWIDENWTDMRPLSLRLVMDAHSRSDA